MMFSDEAKIEAMIDDIKSLRAEVGRLREDCEIFRCYGLQMEEGVAAGGPSPTTVALRKILEDSPLAPI